MASELVPSLVELVLADDEADLVTTSLLHRNNEEPVIAANGN